MSGDCDTCRHLRTPCDKEPCRSCVECVSSSSAWEPVEPPAPAVVAASGCPAGDAGPCYVGFPDARPEPAGVKLDGEKTRWDLMPWPALELVAQALTLGAAKYPAPENWRRVPGARRRYFAAAIRHAVAWVKGEKLDPESGLPHLAHLACNALFLLSFELGETGGPAALEEPRG